MNSKQRIIISIIGIFIVLIALLGLTYAYFLTRIKENTNDKSISVATANLSLEYGNGNGYITGSGEIIKPGKTFSPTTFTVTNTGNATVESYAVILENVQTYYYKDFEDEDGNLITSGTQAVFKRPTDFELIISCEVTASPNADKIGTKCTETTSSNLPLKKSETLDETYIVNGILLKNRIEPSETHTYSIELSYKDSDEDQSMDMNKALSGKFNIIDAYSTLDLEGIVTGYTEGDIVKTNSIPRLSQINRDGSYKIVGLEADVHRVKIVNTIPQSPIENEITKISIVKSEISSVDMTYIDKKRVPEYNITDKSRIGILNIDLGENEAVVTPGNEILEEDGYNPFKKGTLANIIYKNGALILNKELNENFFDKTYEYKNQITKASNGSDLTDMGMFTTSDDYGTSFYFRGPVKNNYVNFAGFTWRIVRINGDGSVRLIMNDTLDKTCVEYESDGATCKTYAGTSSKYNSSIANNAYVGYMYGLAISGKSADQKINRCLKLNDSNVVTDYVNEFTTKEICESNGGKWTTNSYEATHANVKDSVIKTNIDLFYETYIENNDKNLHYEQYLADSIFCNDKTVSNNAQFGKTGYRNTKRGFGENITYYSSIERNLYETEETAIKIAKPSLKCAETQESNYSRFTSNLESESYLSNGLSINNDLKHPIALLNADELVLAGAWRLVKNESYYLFNLYKSGFANEFWTMTPSAKMYIAAQVNHSVYNGYSFEKADAYRVSGVRPVINLRADLLVDSGNGTQGEGAYTVKLPN